MSFYSIPTLLGTVLVLFIGIFVYSHNKKAQINIAFGIYCFVLAVWLGSYTIAYSVESSKLGALFCRLACTAVMFSAPTMYYFAASYLNKLDKERKFLILAYGIMFALLPFFVSTKYFLNDPYKYFWGYYSKAGLFHPFFLVVFVGIWARGLFIFKDKNLWNTASVIESNKLKYILSIYVISSLGSLDYIQKYGVEVFPLGWLFEVIFVLVAAYAIVKHQLLEIEVIIKKTLVFAGLFASVFAVLVLPMLIIQEFIVGRMGLGGRMAGLGVSAILIVLVLKPLENFLIKVTDRFLFQKKYDYKELLKTFTGEVLTVLDLKRLTRLTTYKLADIMRIISCGILLLDEEASGYKLVASYGIKEKDVFLTKENTLASFMERTRAYLSISHQGKDSPIPLNIIRDMNRLKVELAMPLILHDKMIGILTLGKKKSDEPYTQDDIDIILPLARTLSIAISNAELFEELSKTQAEAAQREKMAVIGTLSAGINHEICNPLGIVRGQCEAFMLNLKEGLYKNKTKDELLDKAITIMEKTIKEVDRATAVTKRLSSFAKPIKEIKLDEVSIMDEINEVMALVGHELELEKIDVIKNIPKDLPNIIADRKQIEEIFFNIIRNAGQAIGENGKITINAKSTVDGKIVIEIEDTGHGIPEDKLEQIFNPFYTTKEPGKGTGLGLFIVRQIVEKNKGRISVKSKVGMGTTFTLEFPAAVKARV